MKHSLKPPTTGTGLPLPKDVEALHANGSASLAELKEFLGGLHGKSPQEVIGIVSSSLLIQSFGLAIAATIALLAIFTIGPYMIYGPPKAKEIATKAGEAQEAATATPAAGEADGAAKDASPTGTPDAEAAAKAVGIDDAKSADPGSNPLDKGPNLDNLLDGVP